MKKLTELNTVVQLEAHAARSTTANSGAVAAPPGTLRGIVIFDVSAVGADADETRTMIVEGRVVAGTGAWVSAHSLGEPASLVATQPAGAQIGVVAVDAYAEYRVSSTVGGATPSLTYGAHLLAEISRHPAAANVLA